MAGRPWEDEEEESIDGDLTVARFHYPQAVAVASDGTIYVGECEGERVRQIRDGIVSTVCQTEDGVGGLFLDESEGLLYATCGHRIITVAVDTALQAFLTRVDPVLRTWCLMQEERAQMIPAAEAEDAQAARVRKTLRLLMRCPIADVAFRVCTFAF